MLNSTRVNTVLYAVKILLSYSKTCSQYFPPVVIASCLVAVVEGIFDRLSFASLLPTDANTPEICFIVELHTSTNNYQIYFEFYIMLEHTINHTLDNFLIQYITGSECKALLICIFDHLSSGHLVG